MTAKDLRAALLQEAVQGKLVPQIESEGNARDLLEQISEQLSVDSGQKKKTLDDRRKTLGKKNAVVGKKTAVVEPVETTIPDEGRPFDIPQNWCWCRLGEICSDIADIDHKMPAVCENGIPYISPLNFCKDGSIDFDNAKKISREDYLKLSKKCKPEFGDIIFPRYGTIGVLRKIETNREFLVSYSCATIKPHLKNIDSEYIYYVLLSPLIQQVEIQRYINKTTQPNVGLQSIKKFLFPLPPLAEQKRIVSVLEKMLPLVEEYGKKEEALAKLNADISALAKKAVLQEAVQGKLVPPACRQAGKLQAKIPCAKEGQWFVYVIECQDGSFYKGFTTDLQKRYEQHCKGIGAEWTRIHKPKQLFYWEIHYSEKSALEREKYLKSGCGREWFKKEVVDKPENWQSAHELLLEIRKKTLDDRRKTLGKKNAVVGKKTAVVEPVETTIPDDEKPFDIPQNWCWCRLGEICSDIADIDHKMPAVCENGIPYISPLNFCKDGSIDFDNAKKISREDYLKLSKKCKPEFGDIIFPRYGTIGVLRKIETNREFLVSYSCATIKPHLKNIDSEYIYYVLLSPLIQQVEIQRYINKTTQPNVGLQSIKKFLFPLPPLAEQKRIVAALEKILPLCEKLGK